VTERNTGGDPGDPGAGSTRTDDGEGEGAPA
jgi:hypothetical protein